VPNSADPRRRAAPKSSPRSLAPTQDAGGDAIHPPIDWANELERTAKNSTSDDGSPRKRDFGFPLAPSAGTAKRSEFHWDRAATHRLEVIPEGGLLVNLNDNCVLVLFPLPFAGCAIGKRKANGDLFEHMQDSPAGDGIESRQ
jgi:hypothetical protein